MEDGADADQAIADPMTEGERIEDPIIEVHAIAVNGSVEIETDATVANDMVRKDLQAIGLVHHHTSGTVSVRLRRGPKLLIRSRRTNLHRYSQRS